MQSATQLVPGLGFGRQDDLTLQTPLRLRTPLKSLQPDQRLPLDPRPAHPIVVHDYD
jgi:hypothetical protein